MNPRYITTPDSFCTSGAGVLIPQISSAEENITVRSVGRTYRNSPPPLLIGLAMKISRSRWYSFMRRVFHYQNGSGSNLGPNPLDSKEWMLMEFIALVVQISSTTYTLMISKGERPVWPMRMWVSEYAFGCLLSLLLLHCRYRHVYLSPENSSGSDIEQQRSHEETRTLPSIHRFRTWLELLFAVWFVMGNVWMFDTRFGSYHRAPKLHVLCISLLAWNALCYSFPFILFVLLCCCVPLLSSFVGYNMNTNSLHRGATEDQLARLPSWKFKDIGDFLKPGDSARTQEAKECCICLAKYRAKEDMRQLPCTHIFHLPCVDQWLKIISCCPLCKQEIQK